jgi:hypothetical protein
LTLDVASTEWTKKMRPGPSYACVYKQRGAFGLFTFPQWKGLPCTRLIL